MTPVKTDDLSCLLGGNGPKLFNDDYYIEDT